MSANTFTAAFEKIFGRIEQNLKDFTVSEMIAGKEADVALRSSGGKQYQYTSYSEGTSQLSTPGTDLTIDTNTAVATTMDINTVSAYAFPLANSNRNVYSGSGEFLANRFIDARKQLIRDIDGDFLGEYSKANNNFDDGDIGGTDGNAISLTSSNAITVFSEAVATIQNLTGDTSRQFAVITPKQKAKMEQANIANGFNLADQNLKNGFLGSNFLGVNWFLSSYLSHEVVITFAAVPSNTETFIINGVTTTAVTSIGTTAGNFLIGASATTAAAALEGLINAPGTTSSTQVALSTANQRKFRGLAASAASGVITLVSKRGQMTFTNNLSNVTLGTQFVHNVFGEFGSIERAWTGIENAVTQEPKQLTKNYISQGQYGVQVPAISKDKFIDVRIKV